MNIDESIQAAVAVMYWIIHNNSVVVAAAVVVVTDAVVDAAAGFVGFGDLTRTKMYFVGFAMKYLLLDYCLKRKTFLP